MRVTQITPPEATTSVLQSQLTIMWALIEDSFEEDWHVALNGDLILQVDNDFLHRIADKNYLLFESYFEATQQHNPETRKWEWSDLPEHLQGEYIIRGVYSGLVFLNGPRSYFFTQEGA